VDRIVIFFASGAYVGYVPVASGTFGSLLALPLLLVLARSGWSPAVIVALMGVAALLAMPVCGRAGRIYGEADSSRIVLDEVCGMLIAGALLPPTVWALGLAFAAFRFFDIVKPFPASYFDHHVKNGAGVVADDLVAGVYANLVVRMLL
jgi:phosphatidylglycerophosphatase A